MAATAERWRGADSHDSLLFRRDALGVSEQPADGPGEESIDVTAAIDLDAALNFGTGPVSQVPGGELVAGAKKLPTLNPQTQDYLIG